MYYFQNAIKDTTLYKQQPTQNTGLDEVLEISKTYYGDVLDIAHPLLKFNIAAIKDGIDGGDITMTSADLVLRECESSEIPTDYIIEAHPVSQSWDMGIGTRFDDISTDGATWISATTTTDWSVEGGDVTANVSSSETLSYLGYDIEIDVKNIIESWNDDTNVNYGFLLKYPTSFETNTTDYGTLQYFSKETNTIYQPKLRIGWDDSDFAAGSLPPLNADDIHVTFKRLKPEYKLGSIIKIKVFGREKYPLKTYTNQYGYDDIKYLPDTTYYQIRDVITNDIIIPFSDYSKVSCNSTGNYFKLNLKNWEINRDYYIEIKTVRDGLDEYFSDKNLTFNIVE